MDNMASHFELLDWYLAVLWEEKNVPIFVTHFEVEYGKGAASSMIAGGRILQVK